MHERNDVALMIDRTSENESKGAPKVITLKLYPNRNYFFTSARRVNIDKSPVKRCKSVESNIAKWYAGKHILITGATGFMGKVLVEKLLRSCSEISTLYLLIRTKHGEDPMIRIERFIDCPLFDQIRSQSNASKQFAKLRCIPGDITQENLKVSKKDQYTLQDKVNIVFHMAANVRFDQSLKSALKTNTLGTKYVLEMASTFRVLEAFVHVSTAYCQSDITVLEEQTYPPPHDPRKVLDIVDWLDDDLLLVLTPHLLKNAPNTYSYTKCLTEHLVSEYTKQLPIAIARPGSVTASYKEPIPGWVDNLNGPTGILVGAGKGVIRTMHCNAEFEANIIPVDSVINSLIIVGYHLGCQPRSDIEVFNITSDKDNQITWGDALEIGKKHIQEYPFSTCLWYPGGSIKNSYFVHEIYAFFLHLLPAYFIDFLLILAKEKPFLVKTQKRIKKGLSVLQYYTTKRWYFHNDKLITLVKSLNKKDQEIFYCGGPKDYDKYILHYILGARKYCLNEDPNTIPHAKRNLKSFGYVKANCNGKEM
ncbi:hypothetical protein WA026_002690 [Henosepilachna vigintioctopunctata]|uniref:Fatty acyl-CoA reductase n=1 Tax=Henosepilachna vigintioctopunctata TaxID=420089 RepID=A0AAW1U2E2_9CUCU